MEIVTTEVLPPEASMAGTNTVYCHCQALNKRNNYGVCLFTLKAFEEARLNQDSDCYSVINSGSCEARKLRQQERDAGRALFFKKREIPVTVVTEANESRFDRNSDSFKRGWARGGISSKQPAHISSTPSVRTKPTVSASKPKREEGFSIKGSLSEAVTAAVKIESSKAAQPAAPTKPMSLLERARLAASSK